MAMTTTQMGILARVGVDRIVKNYDESPDKIYPRFIGNMFDTNQAYMLAAQVSDFSMANVVAETAPISFDTWRLIRSKQYTPVNRAIGYQVSEQAKETDLYNLAAQPVPKIMLAMDKTEEQVYANILNLGFSTATANLGADSKSLFATDHTQDVGSGRNKASTAVAFSYSALNAAITDLLTQKSEKGDPFPSMGPWNLVVPPALYLYAKSIVKSVKEPGTPNNNPSQSAELIQDVIVNPYLTSTTAWFLIPAKKIENPLFSLKRISRRTKNDYDIDHLVFKFAIFEEYIGSFLTWRNTWGTEGA